MSCSIPSECLVFPTLRHECVQVTTTTKPGVPLKGLDTFGNPAVMPEKTTMAVTFYLSDEDKRNVLLFLSGLRKDSVFFFNIPIYQKEYKKVKVRLVSKQWDNTLSIRDFKLVFQLVGTLEDEIKKDLIKQLQGEEDE